MSKAFCGAIQKTGVYIGNFVALPHGEEEAQQWIKEEGLFLIQVPDGVDFGTKEQTQNRYDSFS